MTPNQPATETDKGDEKRAHHLNLRAIIRAALPLAFEDTLERVTKAVSSYDATVFAALRLPSQPKASQGDEEAALNFLVENEWCEESTGSLFDEDIKALSTFRAQARAEQREADVREGYRKVRILSGEEIKQVLAAAYSEWGRQADTSNDEGPRNHYVAALLALGPFEIVDAAIRDGVRDCGG